MIKAPAVFLSFDDQHIREWHTCLPLFAKHKAHVTFYVSPMYPKPMEDGEWELLREIKEAGHTIGFHGLRHLRAGNMVHDDGCKAYADAEILPGLKLMKKNGIGDIHHFSYPYGNRTEDSDRCLLQMFDTLRMGGFNPYLPKELREARLIRSMSFGARAERKFRNFRNGIRQNKVVCTYMHKPVGKITPSMSFPMEYWLESIMDFGTRAGAKFYGMEELDR